MEQRRTTENERWVARQATNVDCERPAEIARHAVATRDSWLYCAEPPSIGVCSEDSPSPKSRIGCTKSGGSART